MDQRSIAAALGKIPSGIFILTARRGEAETGMLASWIQQCSFDPPLVTIAIRQGRHLGDLLSAGAALTINILDESQTDMVIHFGRGFDAGVPAFEGLEVQRRPDRPPVLSESLAYLDCELATRHSAGDHELFICKVLDGGVLNEGRPMVHVRKSGFHY
jgi:flavin reductase (DIM6/NTAB) family NADH-FMN oxidoreductase RutF